MSEYQWKNVSVVGFDELMQALDRADRKGYMPIALQEEWEGFNWQIAPPQRQRLTHEQAKALVAKYGNDPLNLVFQTEAAHGIGGKT
jgi:hypothetical protein